MTSDRTITTRRHFLRTALLAAPAVYLPGLCASAEAARLLPPIDLRFITSQLPVHRRAEWTRTPPNPARLRITVPDRYNRITVHHEGFHVNQQTAQDAVGRHIDGVLAGHLKRKFGDIGYHFVIDYAGRVWEGRSMAYRGAHVSGENENNIGIMLLGNFERQRPSRVQLASLEKLTLILRRRFRVRQGRVYGHIDLGHTLCPGRYLYGQVFRLNQLA